MTNVALPKFRNPPVIETVMGVEFVPLEGWGIPHYGLFWSHIRNQLPSWEVHPPVVSQVEAFDRPSEKSGPRIELAQPGEVRCWFLDTEGASLLQIQNDR